MPSCSSALPVHVGVVVLAKAIGEARPRSRAALAAPLGGGSGPTQAPNTAHQAVEKMHWNSLGRTAAAYPARLVRGEPSSVPATPWTPRACRCHTLLPAAALPLRRVPMRSAQRCFMDPLETLLNLSAMAEVAEADLQRLLEVVAPVSVDPEVLLMDVGDVGDDIVIVLDGGFAVELGVDSSTLPLAFVGTGEILGEAALFRPGSTRSARVRAVQPSIVLRMDAAVLDQLAREGNGVPRAVEEAVMRTLARRIHDSVQAIDGVLSSALEIDEPKGALARLRELFRR